MTEVFRLTGTKDMVALSKALKGWDNELRRQLHRDFRDAAKPLIPVVREALRESYPQRGGLAEQMARSKIRITFKTGRNPGIQIVIPGLQAKLGENYGLIRHPVYADPNKTRREQRWVAQKIDAGAVHRAVSARLDLLIPGVEKAINIVNARVLGRFNKGV